MSSAGEDPRLALRARLEEPLPEQLWSLPTEQLADLNDALSLAHQRQAVALDRSIDKALGYLPWLLRGVVRKVLLG